MSKLYVIVNSTITQDDAQVVELEKKTETIIVDKINTKLEDGTVTKEGLLVYTNYFHNYNFTGHSEADNPPNKLKYGIDIVIDIDEKYLFEGTPHDTLVYLSAHTTDYLNAQVVTPQAYGRILSQHSDEINQSKDLLDYLEMAYPAL